MDTASTASSPLTDIEVVAEVSRLAHSERTATAALVAALAELDARRLYLGEGYPSLFAYCTQRLHYSEHAAYHRIEAARASRRFPLILERLQEGELTLTTVGLLRPHLTEENHREVLDAARHQGKRAIEELVARLHARPDVRTSVRRLPGPRVSAAERTTVAAVAPAVSVDVLPTQSQPSSSGSPVTVTRMEARAPVAAAPAAIPSLPSRPSIVRPLAPARYQVQITVSADTHAKLRHAQDLLRHVIPDGDLAAVFDRALTLLIAHMERTKCGATKGRRNGGQAAPRSETLGKLASQLELAPSEESRARSGRTSKARARPRAAANSRAETAGAECSTETPAGHRAETVDPVDVGPSSPAVARRSRHVPAAVRRAVWARDEGRCSFVGPAGRCPERGFLEFHHREPFADRGETSVANLALLCRQHNQWEGERYANALADITEPTRPGPS